MRDSIYQGYSSINPDHTELELFTNTETNLNCLTLVKGQNFGCDRIERFCR